MCDQSKNPKWNQIVWLIGLLVALCGAGNGCSPNKTTSRNPPDPAKILNVPRSVRSTNEIKLFFEKEGIPIDLKEVQGKEENYCFVLAYPYSGSDTVNMYCYVEAGHGWIMFVTASLWKCGPGSVEFKSDGDFVSVLCHGVVVLKLHPPK